MFENVTRELFALGEAVRYVALGEGRRVRTVQRRGLESPSGADSDRFEELFVNPGLVTLARQRGEVDCGGLRHIVAAYGNFTQLVMPTKSGHLSISLEKDMDAGRMAESAREILRGHGMSPREIR